MIESILQRFAQGEDLTKEDLCTLLRVPVGSRDYYNLLAEANGYSRKAFEGKGLLFGQIGLDIQPCRINCKFCSLAADFLKGCTPFIRDPDDTVQLAKQLADSGVDGEIAEEIPDTTGECQITLELFKDALKKYADQHNGAFPAGEDLDGVRELLKAGLLPLQATICPGAAGVDAPAETIDTFGEANCSFIYFGGFTTKSNPKLPLVVDWPLNHEGAVNVLLVDGTIEKLDIDAGNCKRIVSKLQTIYQYREKEFRRLIELADKLDRKFGLDQQ